MTQFINKEKLPPLIVGAIGIVYGDIGTSPLYALKSCLSMGGVIINQPLIIGVISLFIWSLLFIVSFKYVRLVLTMDHKGEGGILALSTLVTSMSPLKFHSFASLCGIIGMALFFGDGIITPAISVLSAVEGISLINTQLIPYIVPITIGILTALFRIQKLGSRRIGQFFGPVMISWFCLLFVLGVYHIFCCPLILKAFNPYYALSFLWNHSWSGLAMMGGVILVVTGAEALYADLGHFGKRPIHISWVYLVLPALIANYLGQGALLLGSPEAISNPFYLMVPSWALQPVILLATLATIIASQSIITGLFSITWQAILLNYLPRMKITKTSEKNIGQVYLPVINYGIYVLTLTAVLIFGSSEKLAVAYGLCVSGIMFITTILIFLVAWEKWGWHKLKLIFVFAPLFFMDILFVSTNLLKFFHGAWYVLTITLLIYYVVYVWRKGSEALYKQKIIVSMTAKNFIENHLKTYRNRLPGTALFLCREPFKIPSSLVMHLFHNTYLHEKIIFVSFIVKDVPYEKVSDRFKFEPITNNCSQLIAHFGFKEMPNLNKALQWLKHHDIIVSEEEASIFLGKGIPVVSKSPVLSGFSEKLYIVLSSLSQNASDFYNIPHRRVIELGGRYKI